VTHGLLNQAYPAGKHFTVPPMPNVTAVNALGDFIIAADRLAIIDGEGKFFAITLLSGDVLILAQSRSLEALYST
jgi:hypothetical protein